MGFGSVVASGVAAPRAVAVLASIAAFFVLRHELRGQVDDALAEQYTQVATRLEQQGFVPGVRLPGSPFRGGAPSGPVQLLGSDGSIFARVRRALR